MIRFGEAVTIPLEQITKPIEMILRILPEAEYCSTFYHLDYLDHLDHLDHQDHLDHPGNLTTWTTWTPWTNWTPWEPVGLPLDPWDPVDLETLRP